MFQHYAAFAHMSVRENIAFGLRIRKRPKDEVKAKVDELLDIVGLTNWSEQRPSQLSGGQRQRMALARALAVDPRVLLLDEPFGALDAKVRAELRRWLRRLHDEQGVTTVLVTHDQEEAMEVADRIAVMNHAHIEQVGSPREVYDKPATEFVMGFLGPVSTFKGKLVRPHDVTVSLSQTEGSIEAMVSRVVHLGFEVRIELELPGGEQRPGPADPRPDRRARARARRHRLRPPAGGRDAPHRTRRSRPRPQRGDRDRLISSRARMRALPDVHARPGQWRMRRWLPGDPGLGVLGELVDRLRELTAGDVGDGDVLDDPAQVRPHRDPHAGESGRRPRVLGLLGRAAADRRERALDGADDVRDGQLGRRFGEPEAALGAAVAAHDAGVPELAEDVLQEVERDALGRRDPLGLDRLLVGGSREFDGCPHGIVGFGRDSHGASVTRRSA